MHQPIRAARPDEVPVLDLGPLNTGGGLGPIAKELRHACETIGFFYVANHCIPDATFDGVFDATRRYFDLPEPQRLAHRMDERFRRGFMPQGINQHPGYAPDLKESYAGRRNAHGCARRLGPTSRSRLRSANGSCACSRSVSTCRPITSCSSA